MPKIRRSKIPPPEGWDLIEPTLDELDKKMREAEAEPSRRETTSGSVMADLQATSSKIPIHL